MSSPVAGMSAPVFSSALRLTLMTRRLATFTNKPASRTLYSGRVNEFSKGYRVISAAEPRQTAAKAQAYPFVHNHLIATPYNRYR
jgi:hypothetical protein